MKVLWLSKILHGIIIANKEPLFRTSVEHRHEVLKCAPLCTDQIQIFKMMKCVHCRAFRHNSLYCIACNCCCLHWADISVIKYRCIIDYVFAMCTAAPTHLKLWTLIWLRESTFSTSRPILQRHGWCSSYYTTEMGCILQSCTEWKDNI